MEWNQCGPRGSLELEQNLQAAMRAVHEVRSVAAAENLLPETAGAVWLNRRWAELNSESPPHHLPKRSPTSLSDPPPERPATNIDLVPVQLIVGHGFEDDLWGEISYRAYLFDDILEGCLRAAESGELGAWHRRFAGKPVHLQKTTGPLGPIYDVATDGRHRVMMAKALGLPYLKAKVSSRLYPDVGTRLEWSEQDSANRKYVRYLQALRRSGEIDQPVLVTSSGSSCIQIRPAYRPDYEWRFENPDTVRAVSETYAACYPEFRVSHPHAMLDHSEWAKRELKSDRPKLINRFRKLWYR